MLRRLGKFLKRLLPLAGLAGAVGCAMDPASLPGGFDSAGAKAQTGVQPAAAVELVSIPANPAAQTIVLVVENFGVAAQGITSGGGAVPNQPTPDRWSYGSGTGGQSGSFGQSKPVVIGMPVSGPDQTLGPGIASQLKTVLAQVGNVVVIDAEIYHQNPEQVRRGIHYPQEVGPFLVKGTLTEFNETAEAEDQGKRFDLNSLSGIVQDIGSLTHSSALDAVGNMGHSAGIGVDNTAQKRSGMVGLDIQVVDPNTGRTVMGFRSNGKFVTLSKTSGQSALGLGMTSSSYAASAIGQAQRAALNDAAQKLHQLAERPLAAGGGQ